MLSDALSREGRVISMLDRAERITGVRPVGLDQLLEGVGEM